MLALHLLQDDAHGVGHEFLHYVAQGLARLLEARRQLGQQCKVALLRLRGHGIQTAVHGADEPVVRLANLTIEVGGGGLRHPGSIGGWSPPFNPFLALLLCLGVVEAQAEPVRVSGWLEGLAIGATSDGPRQQPSVVGDVRLAAPLLDRLRAEFEVRGRLGGPYEGGPGAGVQNFDDTFQNHSPYFEFPQAWLEWGGRRFEVRGGIQKVSWGKLDGGAPMDVANPRDFHDPFVGEFEERKIGVPMLVGSYYLPDLPGVDLSQLRVSLAWMPIGVPSRVPLLEERWFPTTALPASPLVVSQAQLRALGVPATAGIVAPLTAETANDTPPRGFTDGGVGLRLAGTWRDLDWDFAHYTGPETGPDLETRAEVFTLGPPLLNPGDPAFYRQFHVDTQIRQAHDVMHMTGLSGAVPLGGFTLRAEAAWFVDRPYLRQGRDIFSEALSTLRFPALLRGLAAPGHRVAVPLSPLFPALDSVEWGIGADYLWHGWLPLVQLNQINILGDAPRLLNADPETRVLASLRKRFFGERLEAEVRGTYEVQRGGWILFPRLTYVLGEHVRLRLGYLAVGGSRHSLFGQYGANDEFVMQARYTF